MEERKIAPEIFTGKDLDYLKDIFGWNHTAYKLGQDILNNIEDKKIYKVVSDCNDMFYKGMKMVIDILKEGEKSE